MSEDNRGDDILVEIGRIKNMIEEPTKYGGELNDVKKRIGLINARTTITNNGDEDRDLAFASQCVHYASSLYDVSPDDEWVLHLKLAIQVLSKKK